MFEDCTTNHCFLKITLYDLKQARQIWYQTRLDFLKKLNIHKIKAYDRLFVLTAKIMFIAVNLDNLFLFVADRHL